MVLNGSQIIGKAKTSTFFLPGVISEHLRKGKELGEASDLIFNKENSKQAGGAVGLLTKGLLQRKDYYNQAVLLSLLPFMNEEIY